VENDLGKGVQKCPRCGSAKLNHIIEAIATVSASLRLKQKSGEKDQRNKPIYEEYIKVGKDVQTKSSKDRSKRTRGTSETYVYHARAIPYCC